MEDAGANDIVISLGSQHTCSRLADGAAMCWGSNTYGQLGDGTTNDAAVPNPVTNLSSVVSIDAGGAHTCAFCTDGKAYCWGMNFLGQLGDGTNTDRHVPTRLKDELTINNGVSQLGDIIFISSGTSHSCGIRSSGTAFCFGDNSFGKLGDNTTSAKNAPVAIGSPTLAMVQFISAGDSHTCAIVLGGYTYCWGLNDHGQIGDGSTTNRHLPKLITQQASYISAGFHHTCASFYGGVARCWGRNDNGQLGDGTYLDRDGPVPVKELQDVISVTAGWAHSCASFSDGNASCWGRGSYGTLGDGAADNSAVATAVIASFNDTLNISVCPADPPPEPEPEIPWADCTLHGELPEGQSNEHPNACMCFQGWAGPYCHQWIENATGLTCDGEWYNATEMQILYAPVIEFGSLKNMELHLEMSVPLVSNRANMAWEVGNTGNCRWPVPTGGRNCFQKTHNADYGCRDVWIFEDALAESIKCGWETKLVELSGMTFVTYHSAVIASYRDVVADFRGTPVFRDETTPFPLKISLQTGVALTSISADTHIYAPINSIGFVTQQTYDEGTGLALIRGRIQTQWPFEIKDLVLKTLPSNISGELVALLDYDEECPDTPDTFCWDSFELTLDPGDECFFTGAYELEVTYKCRDHHLLDCPITYQDDHFRSIMTLDLVSHDLCAHLEIDVGLTGTLTSYEDEAMRYPTDNFFFNSGVFFKATVAVTGDSQDLSIASSEVLEIYVLADNLFEGSRIFYQNIASPPVTAYGSNTNFSMIDIGITEVTFTYKFLVEAFNIDADNSETITTVCRMRVEYTGMSNSRRHVTIRSANHEGDERTLARSESRFSSSVDGQNGFSDAAAEITLGPRPTGTLEPVETNYGEMKDAGATLSSFFLLVADAVVSFV